MKTSSRAWVGSLVLSARVGAQSLTSSPIIFSAGVWDVHRTTDMMTDATVCTAIYKNNFGVQLGENVMTIAIADGVKNVQLRFDSANPTRPSGHAERVQEQPHRDQRQRFSAGARLALAALSGDDGDQQHRVRRNRSRRRVPDARQRARGMRGKSGRENRAGDARSLLPKACATTWRRKASRRRTSRTSAKCRRPTDSVQRGFQQLADQRLQLRSPWLRRTRTCLRSCR